MHGPGTPLRPLFGPCGRPQAGRNGNRKEGIMEIRQRQRGSIVCLDVDGRLVVGVRDGLLQDKVNSLLLQGHRHIILNLEGVSQIDTSGLAALTHVGAAAERHGATIKLLNLPRRIYDLLVITKLIGLFDVFESEAEALRSFRQLPDVRAFTD
jgi:anti-sigma B factor antagonist